MDLTDLTILQAHQGLMKKEFSAVELCQAYLKKIEEKEKDISAFLTLTKDLALRQAQTTDKMILEKQDIPVLAGIPIAIKDNILVEDVRTTAGSKILEDYIAPYDATVIKKLKAEKVVILGKTNLDEFAMGASGERSAFGPTRNPHDLTRVPGGSSAGSAAAVAANMSCCALGSDTGGSVRQPASLSGVVGLKPTYGAVSRYGLIAMVSSLDQIGPLTKTVEDCKIVFDVIAGKDPLDSTSVERKPEFKNLKSKINELRMGVPKEYFIEGIDPEVEKIIKKAIKKYEELGVKIEEISLPHTEYAIATYYIVVPSEVSANLARYDGIKYGYSKFKSSKSRQGRGSPRAAKVKSLSEVYLSSRGEGFGEEVRRRIVIGTYVLSAGYYDAYYLRAQKVRALIKRDFEEAFQKVDLILTPTAPTPAFKIGEKVSNPLTMYLCDVFTAPANLAGVPAISLPAGKIGNLPVGLQIIGKPLQEEAILQAALAFEKAKD